ncbi:MAG: hypothetical protein U0X75_13310 [Acidobacteriota bacterium]
MCGKADYITGGRFRLRLPGGQLTNGSHIRQFFFACGSAKKLILEQCGLFRVKLAVEKIFDQVLLGHFQTLQTFVADE